MSNTQATLYTIAQTHVEWYGTRETQTLPAGTVTIGPPPYEVENE